jgi:hypothetical protein
LANEKGQFHPPFTYVVNLVMFRVKLLFVFPTEKLAIPITDVRKFQLFAVLTLDVIWLSRNKLIHEDIQPDPFKVSQQLHAFLGSHLLAWKNASLPSLWLPPCVGNVKGILMLPLEAILQLLQLCLGTLLGRFLLQLL